MREIKLIKSAKIEEFRTRLEAYKQVGFKVLAKQERTSTRGDNYEHEGKVYNWAVIEAPEE